MANGRPGSGRSSFVADVCLQPSQVPSHEVLIDGVNHRARRGQNRPTRAQEGRDHEPYDVGVVPLDVERLLPFYDMVRKGPVGEAPAPRLFGDVDDAAGDAHPDEGDRDGDDDGEPLYCGVLGVDLGTRAQVRLPAPQALGRPIEHALAATELDLVAAVSIARGPSAASRADVRVREPLARLLPTQRTEDGRARFEDREAQVRAP